MKNYCEGNAIVIDYPNINYPNRKILNRQAAQIARDKKKSRLEYLEVYHVKQSNIIASVTHENSSLKTENQLLKAKIKQLEMAMGDNRSVVNKIKIETNESAVLSSLPWKMFLLICLILSLSPNHLQNPITNSNVKFSPFNRKSELQSRTVILAMAATGAIT